MDLKEFE